jgi:protein-S-isoprenylcysteine O-methyltransferase Ste14
MERPLKYILPAYLLIYFFMAFFWRSYKVWKTTGINPFVLGSTDSAHDFIGRMFKVVFALIVAAVIIYSSSSTAYEYLMPFTWMQHQVFKVVGLVMLAASLVWTLLAQSQMGKSWRIGIDAKHRTELVRQGVFRFSRNPIFLGMIATITGLFLIIPNALTLVSLALGTVLIQIQVRLEEEYLRTVHGEPYIGYCRNVRRWL